MSTYQQWNTEEEVLAQWAKCTKAEREQITAFCIANTEPPPTGRVSAPYGYWFLCTCKNLDTGKQFISAGLKLNEPGVKPMIFRKCIGLAPKIKAVPKPQPTTPVKRKPLSGGERKK